MAAAWFAKYKENLLTGTSGYSLVDDATNGPFCALTSATYTPNVSTNTFYDVGGASDPIDALVGSAAGQQRITAVTVGTVAASVFDGADLTFTAISGSVVTALVIYRHNSGAATTWPLVLYLDNTVVTGLSVTPNGGNITVSWAAGGIARLGS